MTIVSRQIQSFRPTTTEIIIALAGAILFLGGLVYDPLYGGAAAALTILILLLLFVPNLVFYGLIFAFTGWPYYIGIPVGRDLPIPFVLPVIIVTYLFVLIRQALRVATPLTLEQRRSRLDAAVFLVATAIAVSLILSGPSLYGLQSYVRAVLLPLLIFLIARHFIRDFATARISLDLLLVGGAIGGAYAMYEWILGRNPLIERFAPPVGDLADRAYWTALSSGDIALYRSFGFGMNPIFLGTVMAMLMVHAAIRFAKAERLRTKLAAFVLGSLTLGGLLATFSRGPILAAAVALTVLALAYPSLRKYLILALIAGAVYVLAQLLIEGSTLAQRLQDSDNVTLRLKMWQIAWHMFLDHPVAGVGLGQFPDHQLRVVRDHNIGPFFEFGDGRLEQMKTAEEGPLQLLAETGLLGGGAAAVLLSLIFGKLFRALRARCSSSRRDLIVASGLGVVVALISSLTVTIYNAWEVGSIVPVLIAILCVTDIGGAKAPVQASKSLQLKAPSPSG